MVGTDIIEVSRIEKVIKEKGEIFLNRIYTKDEIDYCESKGSNKYQHYAGRFAAKESTFKAVKAFLRLYPGYICTDPDTDDYEIMDMPLKLKDIEIINVNPESKFTLEGGEPFVLFSQWNKKDSKKKPWFIPYTDEEATIHISISHIKEYAIAVANIQHYI